jgi:two-component system sensor histidine kinase PhoQ
MPLSIHLRMVIAASFVLAAFFGLSGYALDKAFRDSVEVALKDRLQGHVYALLAAADTNRSGRMRMPETLPDPRFSNPDSGLYARITGEQGAYRWSSPSLLGRTLDYTPTLGPGERRFHHNETGEGLYLLAFGLVWEDNKGRELAYTIVVAESGAAMASQVSRFRLTLFLWLGGAAVLLLVVQGAVLRWGLGPLRQVAHDLQRIKSGEAELLQGDYPSELRGLTQNINLLIRHGHDSQERYRNSLGDLAHSLKTPLAVLQGAVDGKEEKELRQAVQEQVPRMNDIVQYQLQRAAAAGRSDVVQTVAVAPVLEKIVATLAKVYLDKGVTCVLESAAEARFFGDEGDLFEILGNTLDNAFKYCRGAVRIRTTATAAEEGDRPELLISVEDDGPGIGLEEVEALLRRGGRKDQQIPGQGIGLSITEEIVRLYDGTLEIGQSELGGARIDLRWGGDD